ncbi:toprim domain-containing protein [Methylotuvimicrobium sp. KM1]|uniref:toprim domain-containing protein n=1 Tax=Methylotuvimicrobium sp. KM1 TaxID=3377707 RepID=UPI00384B27C5
MSTQFSNIEEACRAACEAVGVEFVPVSADDHWYVANLRDDRKKGNGRIKLFADRLGGIVKNWKTGEQELFFVNGHTTGKPLSAEEKRRIEAEKKRREAERQRNYDKAARRAAAIHQAADDAIVHPYLVKKQVQAFPGVKVGRWERTIRNDDGTRRKIVIDNSLLIPAYNEKGAIRNLQAIFPAESPELDRSKDFLPGCQLGGCFFTIGKRTDPVLICEGYATGATLHEETGYRVYVAFAANNLKAVALLVRKYRPDLKIIICCDNDKTEGNPGIRYGNEAALAVNGFLTYPPIEGFDFNDYAAMLKEFAINE